MTRLDDVMNNANENESSLSKRCEASEKQLNDWREGKKSINKAQAGTVASVARALDVAVEDLLEPEKKESREKKNAPMEELDAVQKVDAFLNTMNTYDKIMKNVGYPHTVQLCIDDDEWQDEYSGIAVEAMLQRKYFVKSEIVYLDGVVKAVQTLLPCDVPNDVQYTFKVVSNEIQHLSDCVSATLNRGNGKIVRGIDVTYDQLYAHLLHADVLRGGRLKDVPLLAQYMFMLDLDVNRRRCLFDLRGYINLAIEEGYLKLHNNNENK